MPEEQGVETEEIQPRPESDEARIKRKLMEWQRLMREQRARKEKEEVMTISEKK